MYVDKNNKRFCQKNVLVFPEWPFGGMIHLNINKRAGKNIFSASVIFLLQYNRQIALFQVGCNKCIVMANAFGLGIITLIYDCLITNIIVFYVCVTNSEIEGLD